MHTADDEDLMKWLSAHQETRFWWKEYLNHQGVGLRTPAEKEAASRRYDEAINKLSQQEAQKRQEMVSLWVRAGYAETLAQQHWEQLADDVYDAERLRYALQKD